MNRHARALVLVLLVMMGSQVSEADERWPQFRGPGFPGGLGRVRTADQLEYDRERRLG